MPPCPVRQQRWCGAGRSTRDGLSLRVLAQPTTATVQLQPKSWRLNVVMDEGTATLVDELHPWNALCSMLVTDAGIATLLTALHARKALRPMLVTDVGMSFPLSHVVTSSIWLGVCWWCPRNGKVHSIARRWCYCVHRLGTCGASKDQAPFSALSK